MLKKICRLFLGLVVFMGSACVTPTHASSASNIVLVHIQAASPTSAKDEMVSIYNNTPNEINITGWCLKNKTAVSFACFTPEAAQYAYYLPAYSYAVVGTQSFLTTNAVAPELVTKVFTVTNQSSGSIVNSADTISLVDGDGQLIDSVSWGAAIPSGKIMARAKSAMDPRVYETLDAALAWSSSVLTELPENQAELREIPLTEPSDTPVDPAPDDPASTDPNNPSDLIHPYITELLPDAEGSDTGHEFIELYNPTHLSVSLNDYKIRVGPNLEKTYSFPAPSTLTPLSYNAYTNEQIGFSLLNTSSSVQLEYKGNLIGEKVTYNKPAQAQSWALIEGEWQYTSEPTPGDVNSLPQPSEPEILTSEITTVKPCAANQYRSPETNRCRLLTAASAATVQPCKEGQVRNPDTNRCRNSETVSTTQTACKAGQERNPETNRCRTITKMTHTDYGVKGVSTEATSTSWYVWLGIGGVVALILGYAVWEWREELKIKEFVAIMRQRFARIKR